MGKKSLVLISSAFLSALFVSLSAIKVFEKPPEFKQLEAGVRLSMGEEGTGVEIVLVEDFQCRNCMEFSQKVIPKIRSEYVQKGKARFTLIPVAFLSGSQKIAQAVLEVHRQAPERLFSFLEAVLDHHELGDVRPADLIRIAKRLGGIDLAKLQHCMDQGCYNKALEENLGWARELMGARFKTPALYINGDAGSTFSYEAIQYQIEQMGK